MGVYSKYAEKHFSKVKQCSELLAYEYSRIGKKYQATSKVLLEKLLSSRESIKFQLQRIYIHRNQIVHSGDFINEYSNIWMNLEWYCGTILTYFLLSCHFLSNKTVEEAAQEIEADYDYLFSYLERNGSKKILDLPDRIQEIMFKHNWQAV